MNKQYSIKFTKEPGVLEQGFYLLFTLLGVWIFSKNFSTMVNALENLSLPEHNFIIISLVAFIAYFIWCISGLIDSFKDEEQIQNFSFLGNFKRIEERIEPKKEQQKIKYKTIFEKEK